MTDVIRFYEKTVSKKRLILSGVTEEQAKEWCNDPKTRKAGEWFDGFVNDNLYNCQNTQKPLYPNNYTPDDLPK